MARHNLELTAFRRTTEDIWSFRGEVNPDGVLVTRPFNFGSQALTGAELSARGPILEGLRYVLTANLSDQSLDPDAGGPLPSRHSATWSGTGQLEYKDGQDGRRGADRRQPDAPLFRPHRHRLHPQSTPSRWPPSPGRTPSPTGCRACSPSPI